MSEQTAEPSVKPRRGRGNPQNMTRAGMGREKGSKNKFTKSIKDAIFESFERLGGVDYLEAQGRKNPVAYLMLLKHVMPLQITGADGGPIMVVTGVVRADDVPTIEHEPTPQAVLPPPELPPEPASISRVPSFATPRAPYMPPSRPQPLPEVPDSPAPAAPANQLLGARTAETESGMRVRSLLAPWS